MSVDEEMLRSVIVDVLNQTASMIDELEKKISDNDRFNRLRLERVYNSCERRFTELEEQLRDAHSEIQSIKLLLKRE
jgi:chromosome segregation ATPase